MKKVFSIALVLALAFSFVAPVATSAQTMTFTQNLTIGSRGAEVTALQDFLKAAGFFPATQASTGYFGPITRSAVSAYQASKGITPTAGYFGPITRAQVNAGGSVMPPVTSVPGCPAGALFNYMTGAACSTVTTPVTPGLTGVEGSLDVRLSPTPSDNSNVQTQN
jgi:peptidoglycan hydrolase-like protein with peptidoglycan-binding domain